MEEPSKRDREISREEEDLLVRSKKKANLIQIEGSRSMEQEAEDMVLETEKFDSI